VASHTADGRIIGLNLTHNLARQPARYNENALWVDGRPMRLGLARFQRNRADLMQPWQVSTDCGRIDLSFKPQGGRSEDLKLGLISSHFHQLYGLWSGTLDAGTERFELKDALGLGEDHECRW
jgi:hypothetical protein